MAKIFSVQPRFKYGDSPQSWSLVDGIFNLGDRVPVYGSEIRDAHLTWEWMREPMLAGVFNTWVEKAQTVNWKITGGRNNANQYAKMLQQADNGLGWSYHEGTCAIDYLTTDKGSMEELGRNNLTPEMAQELSDYSAQINYSNYNELSPKLEDLISRATTDKIIGIQHLDSTRMIRAGLPGMRWRYYPEQGKPVSIPDQNLIQIIPMPSGRDRYTGLGYCVLSRVIDAKNLMIGYLNYYRQEIGDLPPELIAIINGLPQTTFEDALKKYKLQKKSAGLDEYGKIMWLGSDDPMTPVKMETVSLINHTKAFDWLTFVEWWMKTLSVNTGEDVGEYWLLQRGESKTVQSIQAMKSKGKGVAKYLQEKERRYNYSIMPYGVRFEYDNQDDEADKMAADILSVKISNLVAVASIGVDRQDPAYTIEQIKEAAIQWNVLPPEVTGDEIPAMLGAMLKEISQEDVWTVTRDLKEYRVSPLLKSYKEVDKANFLYEYLKEVYPTNGFMQHKSEPVAM